MKLVSLQTSSLSRITAGLGALIFTLVLWLRDSDRLKEERWMEMVAMKLLRANVLTATVEIRTRLSATEQVVIAAR